MSRYAEAAQNAEISTDRAKIRRNAFLEEIYFDVYGRILDEIPRDRFPRLLEIGSGGGFFREHAPHATTSDCVEGPGIDRVVDAGALEASYEPGTLDAITAFNVFHHLPNVEAFLRGASQVLRAGGRLVLIEPWFTPIGQWFYRIFHHEPIVHDPSYWGIVGEGRLGGANSRLPTSVFRDDDARFSATFPELRIVKRAPFHKWLYLASGGLRLNTRVPRALARKLIELDRNVTTGDEQLGLFALVVVERR